MLHGSEQSAATDENDKERKALIDKCIKIGVTSKTVERAISAHGLEGALEVVAHTETRFAQLDGKGEGYDPKNYLARMLNDGIGVKSKQDREQEKIAKARAKATKTKWQAIAKKRTRFEELADILERVRYAENQAFKDALPDWEAGLAPDKNSRLSASILDQADSNFERSDFRSKGYLSAIMRETIKRTIAESYPGAWPPPEVLALSLGIDNLAELEAEYQSLKADKDLI